MIEAHAPARPFAIGLSPLGDRPWLVADDRLPGYLAEKARLMATMPDSVFMAEEGTLDAQRETLARVAQWQAARHPQRFAGEADTLTARNAPGPDPAAPPLARAAMLCAEDLVLMRKGTDGWRLAAASLCFPSSWRLGEKFSQPMEAIHAPVPGYPAGTRNALLVNRIFDNLAPDAPVLRGNWSIYGDDRLHHPQPHEGERTGDPATLGADRLHLREERQTLTRLPASGDILFTILITLTPLAALGTSIGGREKAAALAGHIKAMKPAELAYKAMDGRADTLCRLLNGIASGGFNPRPG